MIPFYLERIDVAPTGSHLPKSAVQYFREHFYIAPSGIWSSQMLTHALTEASADRILFAIDYPFVHPLDGSARRFLEQAPISPLDKEKIGHINAERLFKLTGDTSPADPSDGPLLTVPRDRRRTDAQPG